MPEELFNLLEAAVGEDINNSQIQLMNNKKGEGFIGDILFATITNKTTHETKEFVVKQELDVEDEGAGFGPLCFKNEIWFYETVWPVMTKFYESFTGKEMSFIPKYYGSSKEGKRRLILENVKSGSFMLYDKTKPFDDEHFRMIFETFGKFHAVSMAFKELNIRDYNELVSKFYNLSKFAFSDTNSDTVIEFVGKIHDALKYFDPTTEEPVLMKVKILEQNIPRILKQCVTDDKYRGVLLHGDCWTNNFMFKKNVSILFEKNIFIYIPYTIMKTNTHMPKKKWCHNCCWEVGVHFRTNFLRRIRIRDQNGPIRSGF